MASDASSSSWLPDVHIKNWHVTEAAGITAPHVGITTAKDGPLDLLQACCPCSCLLPNASKGAITFMESFLAVQEGGQLLFKLVQGFLTTLAARNHHVSGSCHWFPSSSFQTPAADLGKHLPRFCQCQPAFSKLIDSLLCKTDCLLLALHLLRVG